MEVQMIPIFFSQVIIQASDHSEKCHQVKQVQLFLDPISSLGRHFVSNQYPQGDPCDWRGFYCDEGFISEVVFRERIFGNFNVHQLPPTVTKVVITKCEQTSVIHTRALPRELAIFQMWENKLYGSLDLTTLPEKIVDLLLQDNKISGPISLTRLPWLIRTINICRNNIRQRVVYYQNLPLNVRKILLLADSGETNRIGAIRPINDTQVENVIFLES
uniref:Leucine-rich repeat-containing N-terminal plant-type domain-containing protein n=1 Tax=Paramoeba aestuarina TaxID=180227 RepID=A0A7S4NZ64_9EUKA|mmetsp:Transcript_33349/g.52139  ORF Transcript_33349/g.52139 Transcript_33349/m.52139 type:complete len:217 (+) Transcript_33349:18-668(+)